MSLQEDFEYWGITKVLMDACCALKHYPELQISQNETEKDQKNKRRELQRAHQERFGFGRIERCRAFLWKLTEHPESSQAAKVTVLFFSFQYQ